MKASKGQPKAKGWQWGLAAVAIGLAVFMGIRSSAPVGQSVSEPIAAGATPVIDEDPGAGSHPH